MADERSNDLNAETRDRRFPDISTGPGASDANNGGGAGSGVPDAETGMRTDAPLKGDVEEDREKLFPEARTHRPQPGGESDA
jgi:hypothetical protein